MVKIQKVAVLAAVLALGMKGPLLVAAVMEPQNMTEFNRTVKDTAGPVVVKYYADWCGACRKVDKQFKELASDPGLDYVTFVAVDIDKIQPEKIDAVPAVAYYQGGKKVHSSVGGGTKFANEIRTSISQKLARVEPAVPETKMPEMAMKEMAAEVELPVMPEAKMVQAMPETQMSEPYMPMTEEEMYGPAYGMDETYMPGPQPEERYGYEPDMYGMSDEELSLAEYEMPAAQRGYAEPMYPGYDEARPAVPPYDYERPPSKYRMPPREEEMVMPEAMPPMQPQPMAQAAAAQSAPAQEMGMMAKFQTILRYSLDLIGDMVTAVWDGIKSLLGR